MNRDHQAIRRFQQRKDKYLDSSSSFNKKNKNKFDPTNSSWENKYLYGRYKSKTTEADNLANGYWTTSPVYDTHHHPHPKYLELLLKDESKKYKSSILLETLRSYFNSDSFFSNNFLLGSTLENQIFINFGYLVPKYRKELKFENWIKTMTKMLKKVIIREYEHYTVSKETKINVSFYHCEKLIQDVEILL